jgi:hypothetical protein
VYGTSRPSAVSDFQNRAAASIGDVVQWMTANRLQVNIALRALITGTGMQN